MHRGRGRGGGRSRRGGRGVDCTSSATPGVANVSSGSEAPSSTVEVIPEDFPEIDAFCIARVISGHHTFKIAVKSQGPAPLGIPCLKECRSINVRGLSGNASQEELRTLCSEFGTVTNINLLNSQAEEGLGCAAVNFEKASAAKEAQSCLDRRILSGKVYYKQALACLLQLPWWYLDLAQISKSLSLASFHGPQYQGFVMRAWLGY